MADKCFCHLNGYKVKDADARQMIATLQNDLANTNTNLTNLTNSVQTDITNLTNNVQTDINNFKNDVNNDLSDMQSNVDSNTSNLVDTNVRIDDNDFNTKAMYIMRNYDLDLFVTENFDTVSDIDETKDDGNYVIINNYDHRLHKIVIPSGNIKMIRSNVIDVDKNTKKVFIHIDKEGTGTIDAYFSSDNGVTFNEVAQDELNDCENGKQLVIQLKLTGEVTLNNICWGVRF